MRRSRRALAFTLSLIEQTLSKHEQRREHSLRMVTRHRTRVRVTAAYPPSRAHISANRLPGLSFVLSSINGPIYLALTYSEGLAELDVPGESLKAPSILAYSRNLSRRQYLQRRLAQTGV